MKLKTTLLFAILFPIHVLMAQVKLPSVLDSNMVIQQNSKIKLWGTTEGKSRIEITTSWNNLTYSTEKDKKGNWFKVIETPSAGGPYEIIFKDEHGKVILHNILIGEVWLCSGQSNMTMPLSGMKNQPILNSENIIANATNEALRVFQVEKEYADVPKDDLTGEWKIVNPENAKKFSAVAYLFGQKLQEELDVPVGIIHSSWGGTPIKSWMGMETYQKLGVQDFVEDPHRQPASLYHAMIAPLTSFPIAGILWYQGERDRAQAETYLRAMPAMVDNWRTQWKSPNLPFYYVQIAPFSYPNDPELYSPFLREAQLQAASLIPQSAMVVTADIGSDKTIHPPDKTTVAHRLAATALGHNYGKQIKYKGPEYERLEIKESKILLYFKNNDGLKLREAETANFELAGADRKFYPATGKIVDGHLELESPQVSKPVAARYGFMNYFVGNLFNDAQIPASPFRTDHW